LRYGEDLLTTQADVLGAYHITGVQAFYNNQGYWQRVRESSGPGQADQPAEARYILMTIPGGSGLEFVNSMFMTNVGKINLSAWIFARSDPGHYGELNIYEFPSDVSVVGPQTVESTMNQNPYLSGQISLWNQQGSQVLYGNTIITPVYGGGKISFVYTRPIYLKAQNAAIPSITYVVIDHGKNDLYYAATLQDTLAQLYAGSAQAQPAQQQGGDQQQLISQAKQYANAAKQCLLKGDLKCFADQWNLLLQVIDQLNIPGLSGS
jgi:uncharacterized membrane protein (UPF0182 family)